jgi:hypothetical protein
VGDGKSGSGGIANEENPVFAVVLGKSGFIGEARNPDRITGSEIPAEDSLQAR